jgi:hypothetical protein
MRDEFMTCKDDEALYLMGFCFNPQRDDADCYTLITSGGEIDRPIVADRKIVFFNDPALAPIALSLSDNDMKRLGPAPQEVVLVCDIPEMLRLIETERVDETAAILNCLNTFFDLLQAVKKPLPPDYKRMLYALADHLTFHREFGAYLQEQQIDRVVLREAIEWCMETIFSQSKFLSLQSWNQESRRDLLKIKSNTKKVRKKRTPRKQKVVAAL